jgi:hypothetical protein
MHPARRHALPEYIMLIPSLSRDLPEALQQLSLAAPVREPEAPARELYFALLQEEPASSALALAADYLERQLKLADALPCDLPADPAEIPEWILRNTQQVGRQYRDYLAARREGAPRAYFSGKAHALHFLKGVAPTKLVDGAWLYGLTRRWNDARFLPLIRIYLEELGNGVPERNHVLLFRRLLASHGCERWEELPDANFVQGAIQLALAHHAERFLPELIGFNLGYEQLPLHLLICAYELDELGIDPMYFTLHVTVDNADSGHARKALEGLRDAMPRIGDRAGFLARVARGYRLNMLGAGTHAVIKGFDLQREVEAIFAAKSLVGREAHSDYCRIAGRTVNDWLSEPQQIPAFLAALEQHGWIRRNDDPQQSRFWRLLDGPAARMFGVFTSSELQAIRDWIAGDWQGAPRELSFRARSRLLEQPASCAAARPRGVLRSPGQRAGAAALDEFGTELRLLEDQLAALDSRDERMALLSRLMAPALHHGAAGLMATRVYSGMLA